MANSKKKTEIISVYTSKGGSGKSTTNILLASWLHYVEGKNVIFLDFDPLQYSSLNQRQMQEGLLEHMMTIPKTEAYTLNPTMEFVYTYLNEEIIPKGIRPYEIIEIDSEIKLRTEVSRIINSGIYDYVFIDCQGIFGDIALEIVCMLNYLFVPIELSSFHLGNLISLNALVGTAISKNIVKPNFKAYYYWAMHAGREVQNLTKESMSELANQFATPLTWYSSANESVKKAEKLVCSTINPIPQPYIDSNPNSPLLKLIFEMVEKVTKQPAKTDYFREEYKKLKEIYKEMRKEEANSIENV